MRCSRQGVCRLCRLWWCWRPGRREGRRRRPAPLSEGLMSSSLVDVIDCSKVANCHGDVVGIGAEIQTIGLVWANCGLIRKEHGI